MEASNPPPVPQQRSWWQRNWKWFVPTGCLTLLLLFAAIMALFAFGILGGVMSVMKSSNAYRIAVHRAESDQRVIAALGTPIHEGFFVSGNVNTTNGIGQADLSVPLSGPKGSATLSAVASKSAGDWNFSKMVVRVANPQQEIDLLAHPD